MVEPIIFQDKDKFYDADTCEPLKAAAKQNEVSLQGWGLDLHCSERVFFPRMTRPHCLFATYIRR